MKFLKKSWLASNGSLLWNPRNNFFYSTGAYVVNVKNLAHVFDKASYSESMNTMSRFNTLSSFIKKCNKSDTSISGRCRCMGGIKYYSDKYIYRLNDISNSYVSTIPLANYLVNVKSEISLGHSKFQTKVVYEINKLYLEINKTYQHLLPSYIIK
jgi:hypothetical protein